MTLETFNTWSTAVTDLGLAILWQSALLAGIVAGVCLLLRRSSPVVRYWCWQIVALKLLLMPLWTLAIPLPDFFARGATTAPTVSGTDTTGSRTDGGLLPESTNLAAPSAAGVRFSAIPLPDTSDGLDLLGQVSWRSWLVLGWLASILWQLGRLLVQRGRLARLLRQTTAATEPRLLALVNQVAGQLGLHRPEVAITDVEGSPFVCGLLRPVLVLPRGLLTALDAGQWREVLLHELAHLKRRDLWWGWIPEIARLIYFFHPVAHWVCSRIRLERELACDQLAMALSGRSAADYALVLVQVVGHASMPSALKAAASSLALDGGAGQAARPQANKEHHP